MTHGEERVEDFARLCAAIEPHRANSDWRMVDVATSHRNRIGALIAADLTYAHEQRTSAARLRSLLIERYGCSPEDL